MTIGNHKSAGPKIFRRKIFYLAGFDPRGGRFYHQLLADEVQRTGLAISPRQRAGDNIGWTVTGADIHAEHIFLMWDDIVRANWPKGPLAVLRRTLTAYQGFIGGFDWTLVRRAPKACRTTLFYPGVSLFLVPLAVMLVASGLLGLLLPPWTALLGAALVAGAASLVILRRMHSLWLLRFIMFNDMLARHAPTGDLAARITAFADSIAKDLNTGDADEVLFVTHSNGSILAVPIMADLMARRGGAFPANFALVTLGNCIPLIAARRDATWFHAALDQLAAGGFRWLDIGSLTDGACVPLVPPCLGRPVESPPGLTQLSPRWFRYADPATYKARRADKYATHFDYLRRLDRPSPMDYVAITCAPQPLSISIKDFLADNAQGATHD